MFAWEYLEMKGIDPAFHQHHINLKQDAIPIIQQRYKMNPNYSKQVKEELGKLLAFGFIKPIHEVFWLSPNLSPIVIVLQKNGRLKFIIKNSIQRQF